MTYSIWLALCWGWALQCSCQAYEVLKKFALSVCPLSLGTQSPYLSPSRQVCKIFQFWPLARQNVCGTWPHLSKWISFSPLPLSPPSFPLIFFFLIFSFPFPPCFLSTSSFFMSFSFSFLFLWLSFPLPLPSNTFAVLQANSLAL